MLPARRDILAETVIAAEEILPGRFGLCLFRGQIGTLVEGKLRLYSIFVFLAGETGFPDFKG